MLEAAPAPQQPGPLLRADVGHAPRPLVSALWGPLVSFLVVVVLPSAFWIVVLESVSWTVWGGGLGLGTKVVVGIGLAGMLTAIWAAVCLGANADRD